MFRMNAAKPQPVFAIWCASEAPAAATRAHDLALRTQLPITREPSHADWLLTITDERLELREAARAHRAGFAVDFTEFAGMRSGAHASSRQPLVRAFGKDVETIIDATAGWGRDAFMLASFGFRVTAIERSPIVAALLEDGIARARRDPAISRLIDDRLTITAGNSIELLQQQPAPPDAVYLDPMYPPKKKQSARSRKSIELLRMLVGNDDDAAELFEAAMRSSHQRVIVKRADDAPQLAPHPAGVHAGNTVRYDVYVPLLHASPPRP